MRMSLAAVPCLLARHRRALVHATAALALGSLGTVGCAEWSAQGELNASGINGPSPQSSRPARQARNCPKGFGDCDRDPTNGCETQLEPWETECSICEPACRDGMVCRSGVCRDADPPVKLGAGSDHSCALRRSGAVVCWGDNSYGQLGDGTTVGRTRPVRVSALNDAVDLAVGDRHTCAVRASGAVACWGDNSSRQVGHDAGTESPLPAPVPGVREAVQVTAGQVHSCALLASGKATCWGSSESGQLGDGNVDGRSMPPVPVHATGMQLVQLSASTTHTCALNRMGQVACWGRNDRGQIGDSTSSAHRPSPVLVRGLSHVTQIASGPSHGCAVRVKGDVLCWGSSEGAAKDAGKPVAIPGLSDVVQIGAGASHTCARTSDGRALCWGSNEHGQIGVEGRSRQPQPAPVSELEGVALIAVGRRHNCALTETRQVVCWGDNAKGQLGDGTRVRRLAPSEVILK